MRPEDPGGDRAPGGPALGQGILLLGCRPMVQPLDLLERHGQCQIAPGPDIGAPQRRKVVYVYTPGPQSRNGQQGPAVPPFIRAAGRRPEVEAYRPDSRRPTRSSTGLSAASGRIPRILAVCMLWIASGATAPRRAARRRYRVRAAARETWCCSRMIRMRVAKPGRLPQRGGTPRRSTTRPRAGSFSASVRAPSRRYAPESGRAGFYRTPCSSPFPSSPFA